MINMDSIHRLIALLKAKFVKASRLSTTEVYSSDPNYSADNAAPNSSHIKKRQRLMLVLIIGGAISSFFVVSYLLDSFSDNNTSSEKAPAVSKKNNIKIEIADEALKSERLWVNFFEDKLDDTKEEIEKKIVAAHESMVKTENRLEQKTVDTITEMTEQLRLAKEELESAMVDIRAFREERNAELENKGNMLPTLAEVASYEIESTDIYSEVRNSSDYIPEGTYLDGILVTGISVSTSLATRENPTPVTFRVTGSGNLSKDFKTDVKQCKVTGSSYGDLSSERAIIRLETMTCGDKNTGDITTTKIAGIVYGDDGFNHIKGDVVQTSDKFVKNAMLGGILSGFSQNMKGMDQFAITGLGAISTQKKSAGDMLSSSGLSGVSSAAEKIADYYLKQAESMSPVLQVPGGVKVNLSFTKGVVFGTTDIRDKVANARRSTNSANQ